MNEFTFRYSYGGDGFVFVELSEEMRLDANFRSLAIANKLRERDIEGVIDICPGNGSCLIQLDPMILHPDTLIEELKGIEQHTKDLSEIEIVSRVVDVPILFNDPWTHEVAMRFRDRHQEKEIGDFEYSAQVNGFTNHADFIEALTRAPYLITMLGFVPGLGTSFQLVPRDQQIQTPKYLRPRTFTLERTFGFGGAFACIYPVQGAGGYQMLGMAPAPVFDKTQRLADFTESMVFPRQGDIFRYRPIDLDEFESIRKEVEDGSFKYRMKRITYTPDQVIGNLARFTEDVMRGLYND